MSVILDKLWTQYVKQNPHVQHVYDLFVKEGESPVNDHIAIRTINDPRVNIYTLAQSFIKEGYKIKQQYDFKLKKLKAIHLEKDDINKPKVFISQLLIQEFSPFVQATLTNCIDNISSEVLKNTDLLLTSGRGWDNISYEIYQKLLEESEYAAWFYIFGYCANHFTVFINELNNFNDVVDVNNFLKSKDIKLNSSGGEIKGTPADLLEQSSTLSGLKEVEFSEGKKSIPSCYYEFAKRHPDTNGRLYQGFVASSADKIFESTNNN